MFSLVTYGLSTIIIGAFLYLDGHNIVKNVVTVKYHNFKRINRLVGTTSKGVFTILWVSLCLIVKALWINIIQYMNSTITQIGKNKYLVTYIINGKTYKMLVIPKRGPRSVLMISDENQEDVSHMIVPYLGPEENFHGEVYNPEFFNKKELIFNMSNGDELIFSSNDKIKLK